MSNEDDFDFGKESGQLGGVPGVLRLKDGEELTLLVTGPVRATLDRFGDEAPKEKYALGVYVTDTRARGVVVLSWKGKKDWDAENEKRPFKSHFVRWGRVGTGREGTRYNVSAFPGVTPAHVAEARAAVPLPLGGFDQTLAEIKRRAQEPREAAAPAVPAAPAANGHAPVPQPAAAAPVPSAAVGHVPVPAGPPKAITAKGPNPAHRSTIEKAMGWLSAPSSDVAAISAHVRQTLIDAIGGPKIVELGTKHGVVKGTVPTAEQLYKVLEDALALLQPAPAMAAGMQLGDSDIPF